MMTILKKRKKTSTKKKTSSKIIMMRDAAPHNHASSATYPTLGLVVRLNGEDFTRVQDAVGVKRLLNCPHYI
jgi:hypothetical protein